MITSTDVSRFTCCNRRKSASPSPSGKLHVADGDVEIALSGQPQRVGDRAGVGDNVSLAGEKLAQRRADDFLILDDEDRAIGLHGMVFTEISRTVRRLLQAKRTGPAGRRACRAHVFARDEHRKRRSAGRGAGQLDPPFARLFENVAAHKQPQAGPRFLGGEIGLKDGFPVRVGDAMPVVADGHANPAVLEFGGQLDRSPLVGRVERVEHEVEEDLHQLVVDGPQLGKVVGVARDDPLPLSPLVILGDAQGRVEDFVHVAQPPLLGGRPAEIDQFAERPLDAAELVVDHLEPLAGVRVVLPPLEHLHERADRRQRIADLVGDARGQQTEGGPLLLLDELRLRLLQLERPLANPLFEQLLVLLAVRR